VNYQQTLDYLFSQLPIFQRQGKAAYNKDLGKTIELCKAIGNPEKQLKFVHIAGTNGKGSVCHMLASVFKEAGYKTGLYTSPHLTDFRERIRINGDYISEDFVVDFVAKHQLAIEEIKPSFFELTFAMCLSYFKAKKVDIIVLETGMGGRLDSTNVVSPILSIITNIGLDHQAYLGNTITDIAKEKAGIIKPEIPALLTDTNPEVVNVFGKTCSEKNTQAHFTKDLVKSEGKHSYTLLLSNEQVSIKHPFTASYQIENISTVAAAFSILKNDLEIKVEHLQQGVENVQQNFTLLGRWQLLESHPRVICDVGHNEDGIKQIVKQLEKEEFDKLHFVYGMVNDKSTETLKLLPKNALYYLCEADIPRALPINELNELFKTNSFEIAHAAKSVKIAFEKVKEKANPNDLILVAGSLFVVAEVLALFEN
jgi:dihydrofolate synthase/folylpolyglutamate synthase